LVSSPPTSGTIMGGWGAIPAQITLTFSTP
jgi:hypothetical protein